MVYIIYVKYLYIVHRKAGQKSFKKILKKLKKSVDKWVWLWYYNRAPLRKGALGVPKRHERTLKIKQRQDNKDPTILKRNLKEIKDNY